MAHKITSPKIPFKMIVNFDGKPSDVRLIFQPKQVIEKCTKEDGTPLTQGQFAALVGLSQNTLSRMINNSVRIDFASLEKIMSATGCALTDLFRVEPSN